MESTLSARLRALRTFEKFSAKQVINKLNKMGHDYTEPVLYKWEQGKIIPSIIVLNDLAKIYKCNLSYLIGEEVADYKNLTPTEFSILNLYRNDFLFRSISTQIIKIFNRGLMN